MFAKTIIHVIPGILIALSIASAGMNNGEEHKELSGGSRGEVAFPHRMHQENLGDCNICHAIFPQIPGSIEDLKANGKIEKKQVMNKLCIKCHKDEKRAGNKSGPTTCSKCHVKQ
ncbi:MAG: cytochrome c3 family protein [Deltaproteobacteria bacterium]|nr:cytochrome c3 family protein [Deltaproteobacteria bacterium]MBW2144959.1 cytochrome c3 family protein [Deltaproteobacteria bacterium]